MQRIIMYISIAALTIDIIYVDGPSGTKKSLKRNFIGTNTFVYFLHTSYTSYEILEDN